MATIQHKHVLITGGAGFIGSHLSELFLAGGAEVSVIDDLSTGTMANIEHMLPDPRYHFARTSVTNEVVLDRMTSEADTVIHLAAAVGVQMIVRRPVHTLLTNVKGAEVVLDAALRYGCRTFIASTSEVFGKGVRTPFAEDDDILLGATSKSRWSYAVSKMVDECLAFAYHREYGLPVVLARLFNTVGPRQRGRYGMVIPRMMRQALANEPITVFGDGSQRRCFCDVADVVQAIYRLMGTEKTAGQLFAIGSTSEISIFQLAQLIREIAGSRSEITRVTYEDAYGPGFEDMERRVPDITKIKNYVGWTPTIDLRQTLTRVRDWCAANPESDHGIGVQENQNAGQ